MEQEQDRKRLTTKLHYLIALFVIIASLIANAAAYRAYGAPEGISALDRSIDFFAGDLSLYLAGIFDVAAIAAYYLIPTFYRFERFTATMVYSAAAVLLVALNAIGVVSQTWGASGLRVGLFGLFEGLCIGVICALVVMRIRRTY